MGLKGGYKHKMSDRCCSACKKEIYDSGDVEAFTYCGEIFWLCDDCSYRVVTLIRKIQDKTEENDNLNE
jgi:hypothetical protein